MKLRDVSQGVEENGNEDEENDVEILSDLLILQIDLISVAVIPFSSIFHNFHTIFYTFSIYYYY